MNKQINLLAFLIIVFFNCFNSFSKEIKYKVSEIPEGLKYNSKAVVRYEDVQLEVKSSKDVVQKVVFAITILNNNGIDASSFVQFYNRFSSIKKIDADIYNENGEFVRHVNNSDILDFSAITGYSLYEDTRVKYIEPKYRTVPFTIEFSYEIRYTGILSYPYWAPYKDYNISVESSQFKVNYPSELNLRFLEKNISSDLKKTETGDMITCSWSLSNLPALNNEPYSTPFYEYMPVVFIGPSDFEMDNYEGNFESWNNFGQWIYKLNNERDILDESTITHVKELVKDTENDFEKIEAVYKYMQNKTRYVSLQVGIGGWQPIEAKTVDELSYGDCKALTNYTKALLKAVGIKSNYTLIRAGKEVPPIITDFAFNQFNHAILCVPLPSDTVWLECTSQHFPAGYLSTFTDDRDALMITENGGVIVHTPKYSENENCKHTKAEVSLGDINLAKVVLSYQGGYYDKILQILLSDKTDQKRNIEKSLNISNYKLQNYIIEENKQRLPTIILNLKINLNEYCTELGDRILVPLNPINKLKSIPIDTKKRVSDIKIARSSMQTDTIVYIIPENYSIEQVPESKIINSQYGTYSSDIMIVKNKLLFVRTFILYKGRYPADGYKNFTAFFEDIKLSDNSKFVLRRKDTVRF